MIIVCPDCTTRYSVDAEALAGGGRQVRCYACGNVWQPIPERVKLTAEGGAGRARSMAAAAPPRARPIPFPAPVAAPRPTAAPPRLAPVPTEPAPVPTPAARPVAAAPVAPPSPAPAADPPAAAVPPIAVAAAPAPRPTEAPAKVSDQPSKQLSDEELDALLGGQDNPDPIAPMLAEEEPEEAAEVINPELIPDPEPIPEALMAEEEEEAEGDEGPGIGRLLGLVGGILAIAAFAVVFFMRDTIMETFPGTVSMYEMVGLGQAVGEGFELPPNLVQSSRSMEGDVDIVTVEGIIHNISPEKRSAPNVRVLLLNNNGEEVMGVVTAANASEVESDGRARFRAQLRNPPPTARSVAVVFTKDEAEQTSPRSSPPPALQN